MATSNNSHYWNYGPAGCDRTQQLVVNWVYDLPRASSLVKSPVVKAVFDNWQVSGIYALVSGAPKGIGLTLTDGADLTGGGDGSTVVMTGSARLGGDKQTFYQYFDTNVFRRPLFNERGQRSRRDSVRVPRPGNQQLGSDLLQECSDSGEGYIPSPLGDV